MKNACDKFAFLDVTSKHAMALRGRESELKGKRLVAQSGNGGEQRDEETRKTGRNKNY